MLGKQYRNRKWAGARSEEFDKLNDYEEFKNFGDPKEEAKYFAKYKKIRKHVIPLSFVSYPVGDKKKLPLRDALRRLVLNLLVKLRTNRKKN